MTTILGPFFILLHFTTCVFAVTKNYTDNSTIEQKASFDNYRSNCLKQEKEQLRADYDGDLQCPIKFKNKICWPPTPANTSVSIPCPDYLPSTVKNENASWFCNTNGSWPVKNWQDTMSVSQCYNEDEITEKIKRNRLYSLRPVFNEHLPYVVIMQTIGLCVSIVALTAACFALGFLKVLDNPKNVVHINLFLSCLLRAVLHVLTLRLATTIREEVEERIQNSDLIPLWKWKLHYTVWMYSRIANSIWILIEAVYLILLLFVPTFSDKSSVKWFVVGGWSVPLLFVTPWVLVRIFFDDYPFWGGYSSPEREMKLRWIIEAPIALVLLINCVIFVVVLRLLFKKLQDSELTKVQRYLKLIKSALMLIPLFGIHYIIFIYMLFVEIQDDGTAMTISAYFDTSISSVQGLLVSIVYCFTNNDIRFEVLKIWYRWRLTKNLPRHRNQSSMSTDRRSSVVSESSVLPRSKRRHSSVYSLNQTSTNNGQSDAFGILSLEEQYRLLSLTARPNLEQADLNQNEVKLCDGNNDEGGSTSGEERVV